MVIAQESMQKCWNLPLIKDLAENSQNSPSKLEGVPEGEGVCICSKVNSLQRGLLSEWRFYVLFQFLAVKSGAKSGAMINFRGQPIKFPKTDASHFWSNQKVSVF